jgi:PKD repeat protein
MKRLLPLIFSLLTIAIKAKADCNPAFTATAQGATVQVQATNTTPYLFHSWRSYNSAPAYVYGPSASLVFYAPGTYTITHIVIDSLNHCGDSLTQSVTVNFQLSCAASFTATKDSLQDDLYTFHSTSTASGGASYIYYYEWTLNGTVFSPSYPYSNYRLPIGTNTVCLTIQAVGGCTSSTCQSITVTDTSACNWPVSFTSTFSTNNLKQISFTPTPLLDRFRYTWDFGDGASSNQKTPVHTYAQAGIYSVGLTIYDSLTGCTKPRWQYINVQNGLPSDSCTASFTYTTNPSQPNQVSFTAVSNQTITSQLWWINHWNSPYDSVLLTTNNPVYTFPDTGYYYVCLYITTSTGCSKYYCEGIHITNTGGGRVAATIPSFPNPATSTVGLNIQLTQADRIGITVYNSSGNVVYGLQKQGAAGNNTITIPVQQLRPGQYYIDINYGGQRKRSLFQKM